MAETATAALSTPDDVQALADQLSLTADALHARILRELRRHPEGVLDPKEQAALRALFEDEVLLRQRANGLYADAARAVVAGLAPSQQHLLALTQTAMERLRKIERIRDGMGLVAAVLSLAGAAATGQAIPVLAAISALNKQIKTSAPPATSAPT